MKDRDIAVDRGNKTVDGDVKKGAAAGGSGWWKRKYEQDFDINLLVIEAEGEKRNKRNVEIWLTLSSDNFKKKERKGNKFTKEIKHLWINGEGRTSGQDEGGTEKRTK